MDRYLKILRALRAGKDVSKEDISYFAGYQQNFDEGTYEKLKAKMASEDGLKDLTDEDFDSFLNEARKMLTTGKYKEDTLDLAKQAQQGKLAKNITTGLNTLLASGDIALSGRQIAQSNALQKNAVRPSRPAPLQRDYLLQNALSQASNTDPSRALAPAQLQIQDQYLSDLNNAKTASGGQAGAYGAYAQTAANRRDQANLGLVPIADQIRRQNQARYDQLLGERLNENRAINQSQSQFYPQDLYQYGLDRQLSANLGQIGRQNMRSSITGLAAQIPGALSGYLTNQKYDDIYNQMSAYGAKNAQIASDAHKTIDNTWGMSPNEIERAFYGYQ